MHRLLPSVVAFTLVPAVAAATAQEAPAPTRIGVRFHAEAGRVDARFQALRDELGARHAWSSRLPGVHVYEVPAGVDVERALRRLEALPGVRFAEEEATCTLPQVSPYVTRAKFPDDPLFPLQWPLHNTGQLDGTIDADIDATAAWAISYDASPILVAVSDTGIDVTHPDLAANLWTNAAEANGLPGVDDDANGYVDDVHGFDFVNSSEIGGVWTETEVPPNGPYDDHYHGTASAGTIGAIGDNALGVSGVAWEARIMAVKAMDANGSGSTFRIMESVLYAVDNGARVINCSWISTADSFFLRTAIEYARDHDVLCITAAGNSFANIDEDPGSFGYPGAYDYPNQVTVSSTDVDDHVVGLGPKTWNYGSNYGVESVQVCAPGVAGTTTEPLWHGNGGYRFTWGGTSMAMPHVVGMAALAWAQDPLAPIASVRQRIVDAVDCKPQLDGKVSTGGRVNLHQLLRTDGGPPGTVGDLFGFATWFDRVNVSWSETGGDGSYGLPASCYDLRYATTPVTPASFDTATPVVGEPQPVGSTANASGVVTGLAPATTYHFLLKVRDHHGNETFSNAMSALTKPRPEVDDLAVAGEGVASVDLTFTMPSLVVFSFDPLFTEMDVRYATSPILDDAAFDAAIEVDDEPGLPLSGPVAVHVDGLQPGVEIWFAVVLHDVYGQTTSLSNTVSATPALPSTVVFSDDMESGAGGWVSDGNWGLTTEKAFSGSSSWTDSPGGNYPPNRDATLVSPSLDLSGLTSATLLFNEVLVPNLGESIYVETSANGGAWTLLEEIDIFEVHTDWQLRAMDLSALAGVADVRLRFRFVSNGTFHADGWYVDDVIVGGE